MMDHQHSGGPNGGQTVHSLAEEAQAALDNLGARWTAGDLDGFLQAYADEDDVRYISGDQIVEGRDAIRARYTDRFGQASGPGSLGELTLKLVGLRSLPEKYAFVIARYRLGLADKTAESTGVATLLLKRSEHHWQILDDHSS